MKRILVADDFPDTLNLMVIILRQLCDVDVASDGSSALSLWQQRLDEGEPYALCLLDVAMPDMTGLEVLKKIKEQKPDCPVLLFTADTSVETSCLGVYAGASEVLHKPLDPPILRETIEKYLRA